MAPSLFHHLLPQVVAGSFKALARCISLVENDVPGYEAFMRELPASSVPIIGITGPPGAGKSTLVDALIGLTVQQGKKVGVICVDPSSPFNLGALLGDRIRMSNWFSHSDVFIRSLATRGSLGGLHPNIIEITEIMRAAPFDYVIVETVGVGQSEIEIAGLADATVVVIVPEAGDDIQTMKAGLMEIADIFVVNKADRPEAENLAHYLRMMLEPNVGQGNQIPVLKTIASQKDGVEHLLKAIEDHLKKAGATARKEWLLTEKAWWLLQKKRMKSVTKSELNRQVKLKAARPGFNIYRFIEQFD
jgi:LAO/AO transport system kinase